MPSEEKPCKCYDPDHGWAFNPHPGVKCRKHPVCPFGHPTWNSTLKQWIFPEARTFELGGTIKANGIIAFRVRCVGCGNTSGEIKKKDFIALVERGVNYTWTRDNYAHADAGVCQVRGCGRLDVEMHHFAPQNMFPDADNWPYLPLCKTHHRLWHTTMDGYKFQAKTLEAVEDWHGLVRSAT
jgi:hypothetical protein